MDSSFLGLGWWIGTCLGLIVIGGCQSTVTKEIVNPNIVFILADDLGYGDLGSYNAHSLVPTPNLDRLAQEGVRLTNAYCPASICSPTRYALMTGQYPWRSWKKSGVMANYEPSMIDSSLLTLPELLHEAGYHTAGFGKWHLGTTFPTLDGKQPAGYGKFRADDNGANLDLSQAVSDGPNDHGFNHWLGFSCASECWLLADEQIFGAIGHDLYTIEAAPHQEDIEVIPLEDYLPYITHKAQAHLNQVAAHQSQKPFFLYYGPYVPHVPLTVSPEFQGRTPAGLYGDYVHQLDHYIGELLGTLDSLGLHDNTMVIFASDNGSQFELTSDAIDVSNASNSRENYAVTIDSARLHFPNGVLRGTKWSIYEGGLRTPFIARWPGQFPAGKSYSQLVGLNDMMATFSALVGRDSSKSTPLDSHNALPLLQGKDMVVREELIVQSSSGQYGIIQGKWKYVAPKNVQQVAELYDLSQDESEQVNLYDAYPAVARQLRNRLRAVAGESAVFE